MANKKLHRTSDGVNGLAPLPFTPSYEFESFNTFEDPFSSYSARPAYDVPADSTEPFNEESPSQELDNKLLSFSAPIPRAQIIDGGGILTDVNMTAELYGMFFVAEDVFGGDTAGRPLELTCYRRNLWQCSGQIVLPRNISHFIDEQSQQVQVFDMAASITAIESIEGKTTEIISIPWKSAGEEGSKSPTAPPNITLDLSTGQELDHNRVSLPVSWKRLQFKHATANNGRRKGLQQHYVVQISLLAKAKTGEYLKLADIQSGPVIVRGRSPRNFDSRKDVPLSSDKKAERRTTATPSDTTPVPKVERVGDLAQNLQKYHSLGNVQVRTSHPELRDTIRAGQRTNSDDSNLVTGHHPIHSYNKGSRLPRNSLFHQASAGHQCRRGPRSHRYPKQDSRQPHAATPSSAACRRACLSTYHFPRTSAAPTAQTRTAHHRIIPSQCRLPRACKRAQRTMRNSSTSIFL